MIARSSRRVRCWSWRRAMESNPVVGKAVYPASTAIDASLMALLEDGERVDTGHWQGVETGGRPDLVTKELINLHFSCHIPPTMQRAQLECAPNLPWAE